MVRGECHSSLLVCLHVVWADPLLRAPQLHDSTREFTCTLSDEWLTRITMVSKLLSANPLKDICGVLRSGEEVFCLIKNAEKPSELHSSLVNIR